MLSLEKFRKILAEHLKLSQNIGHSTRKNS